jgi:ribosome maturation factor RimP
MTHPLIPQILELATPIADGLGLEVVGAVLHTHQNPPVLRLDIRNPQTDTGLSDCERMSVMFEAALDQSDLIPDAYILEVSSPGVSRTLSTDREFTSFKGFPVTVTTHAPFNGHSSWVGQLVKRDERAVYLSLKGRSVTIPRDLIDAVELTDGSE